MKNTILILFLSLGLIKEITAQCGTKEPIKDHLEGKILTNMPATASYRFKVFVTILRNSDGTNPACTESELLTAITEMNIRYAPHICFNLMGIKYRDNTKLNTDMNTESSTDLNALTSYNEGGCIDIYIHSSGLRAGSTQLNGIAYDIPNTYLSVDTFNNDVLSHEMGHCLGLSHTHETAHGSELVNGSNCSSAGDRVCDTAADPTTERPCRSESTCGYTGNCADALGYAYSPPINNIMSYYGCRTVFTSGQFSRIYATISTNLSLFVPNQIITGDDRYPSTASITSNTTISSGIETYATDGIMTFGWGNSVIGLYTVTSTGTLYAQATKVRLLPGFRATAGTVGKTRIKVLSCQ